MQRFTIDHFMIEFGTDEACLAWLVQRRWPDGIFCDACEKVTPHHAMTTRKSYSCDSCGHHVHPAAGTIFHKSRTPLRKWFYAIYLMSSTRMGVSAKQLERELGVTYKTAWRMFKQIRSMLGTDEGPLSGTVEIDETFYGGKPRYRNGEEAPRDEYGRTKRGPRPRSQPDAKKPIVGMVERGGSVKAWVTPNVRAVTINPLIDAHVLPATMVYTDEARQYGQVQKLGFQHRRINHSARVYVDGDVHTNTIEGFWSLLKNGIVGTYRQVGAGYLQSYVNEYTFRYNHRDDHQPMFKTILGLTARQVA